ncbi:peptidoglycan recognition family protein [Allocoleopsis sp.]|uniref:peptidoglycan recognition protein family protein n=1 Tax=Allocoleopsis sp. TaxID=3088169 RepID=UPI002FD036D7
MITPKTGRTALVLNNEFGLRNQLSTKSSIAQRNLAPAMPSTCAVKPELKTATSNQLTDVALSPITLTRFRRIENSGNKSNSSMDQQINIDDDSRVLNNYKPLESIAVADPTNYGERFLNDLYGKPAQYSPIVVIHETVGSAKSAINLFQTPHQLDSQQVSYHALIKRSGEVVYIVPPEMRAFGAGNSVFEGENGRETVQTSPDLPPSVNNFAYHVSLETPPDGNNNRRRHSGYTQAQYQSLAWLVAKTGVPDSRITTHKAVDRSGQRGDPRTFNKQTFLRLLQAQPRTNEIVIDCQSLARK